MTSNGGDRDNLDPDFISFAAQERNKREKIEWKMMGSAYFLTREILKITLSLLYSMKV